MHKYAEYRREMYRRKHAAMYRWARYAPLMTLTAMYLLLI